MPFNVILYGEFTTLLVDRKLAVGTSTETLVLGFFGGGQQL
jgi:ATP-binding cassette, subfamily B (MDR/TAP), member 1